MFRIRDCLLISAAMFVAGTAIAESDRSTGNRSPIEFANGVNQSATGGVSKQPVPQAVKEKSVNVFSLMGLDGEKHSMEEWKGKVVILNFWATWCSPCLSEIREFVAYQEQYKIRGLQIIGVGLDEEKKVRNVQRSLEINYPVLLAAPKKMGALMEQWGNTTGIIPYSVVIDRQGRVVFTQRGQIDRDSFNENILPLLAKTEPNPI